MPGRNISSTALASDLSNHKSGYVAVHTNSIGTAILCKVQNLSSRSFNPPQLINVTESR
jgi:hypothetical protein